MFFFPSLFNNVLQSILEICCDLVYWVCGHSLEKLYFVSETPSQHPHGVSKSNKKVTFVPKKTHQHFSLLYNQNTNLSSKILKSCHTLFLLFEIPFLQNQISLSLSSFFSLEFESHLSQNFNSNLIHALTQIPFHPKLAPPNHVIAPLILVFFTLPSTAPLQYLSILGPTTIKSHPHLIFHTILFFFYFFFYFWQLRELRKLTSKCSVGEFLSIFFFQFQTYFFLGLFAALSLNFFGFNLNCIVAKAIASI